MGSLLISHQLFYSTQEFTEGRNRLDVFCVRSLLVIHQLFTNTQEFTLGRNLLVVCCVRNLSVIHQLFCITQEFTQRRNHISVCCVKSPLGLHQLDADIREFIQGRNHISVRCVKSPLGIHQLSKDIWKFTLQWKSKAVFSVLKPWGFRSEEVLFMNSCWGKDRREILPYFKDLLIDSRKIVYTRDWGCDSFTPSALTWSLSREMLYWRGLIVAFCPGWGTLKGTGWPGWWGYHSSISLF